MVLVCAPGVRRPKPRPDVPPVLAVAAVLRAVVVAVQPAAVVARAEKVAAANENHT